MSDNSDVIPLCILYVTKSTKGDRLHFKYPYNLKEPCRHHNKAGKNLVKIEEDLFASKTQSSTTSLLENGQLVGLSDDIMAFLFAVRQEVCSQPLEVKVNDVRFVCFPMFLQSTSQYDGLYSVPKSPPPVLAGDECKSVITDRRKTKSASDDKILLFNIVFGLQGNARRSVVQCYQDLSKRIAIALRHEENRCQYLSLQSKIMMDCIEEMQYADSQSLYKLHLGKSQLAQELTQVFDSIKETGIVEIFINQWIKVSFCLPQRIHCLPGIGSVEPEKLHKFIAAMKPYHGVLLLENVDKLLDEIPADGSPDMARLLKYASPNITMQTLAVETDLALSLVFRLVAHLVYWGKATIIHPLVETNVYTISPNAVFDSMNLHDDFAKNFPFTPCLYSALFEFASPTSLGDFANPRLYDAQEQDDRVRMVVWLLEHFMLVQLRTYVYLSVDPSTAPLASPTPLTGAATTRRRESLGCEQRSPTIMLEQHNNHTTQQASQSADITKQNELPFGIDFTSNDEIRPIRALLAYYLISSQIDYVIKLYFTVINRPQLSSLQNNNAEAQFSMFDDLRLFARLCKYFNGRHHLEDVLFRENLRRSELDRILIKFSEVLVTCNREDELASIFVECE